MFDHISIGVRDLARSKRFYDAALRPLGYVCLGENADALGYGRDKIGLWIGTAARPVPSDTASNLHFCFTAPTPFARPVSKHFFCCSHHHTPSPSRVLHV